MILLANHTRTDIKKIEACIIKIEKTETKQKLTIGDECKLKYLKRKKEKLKSVLNFQLNGNGIQEWINPFPLMNKTGA